MSSRLRPFYSILLGAFFGYSFSASSFTQTAASEGGAMHAHFAQFQGPADVLQALSDNPAFKIVLCPDGKYYLGNSMDAPAAIMGLAATPATLQTNCTGTVLSGAVKGLAGGVKGFVWDGWHALGSAVGNLALVPTIDLGFDLYSIATGTMTVDTFLDDRAHKHKGVISVGAKLMQYTLDELNDPSGDFASFAEGYFQTGVSAAAAEFKHLGHETQQAFITAGRFFTNLWYDLRFGCPERRAQVIGRATFEVVTFYATAAKLKALEGGEAATQATKVTEAELLAKLAQESSLAEVRSAASALLPGKTKVWQLGPGPRGYAIGQAWGENLPLSFKTWDHFHPATGAATSFKSIDLTAGSYQTAQRVRSRVKGYVDEAAHFSEHTLQGVTITADDIVNRTVRIAIPKPPTSAQMQGLTEAAQYGAGLGVKVTWEIF